jgi:hypothetical protein
VPCREVLLSQARRKSFLHRGCFECAATVNA